MTVFRVLQLYLDIILLYLNKSLSFRSVVGVYLTKYRHGGEHIIIMCSSTVCDDDDFSHFLLFYYTVLFYHNYLFTPHASSHQDMYYYILLCILLLNILIIITTILHNRHKSEINFEEVYSCLTHTSYMRWRMFAPLDFLWQNAFHASHAIASASLQIREIRSIFGAHFPTSIRHNSSYYDH